MRWPLRTNTSDIGMIEAFCVLTGAAGTIVGVILYYSSVICYHQRNRGKNACKPTCYCWHIHHNPLQTPSKSIIKCKKLKIQQKACLERVKILRARDNISGLEHIWLLQRNGVPNSAPKWPLRTICFYRNATKMEVKY